jgi:hypothetical protein
MIVGWTNKKNGEGMREKRAMDIKVKKDKFNEERG